MTTTLPQSEEALQREVASMLRFYLPDEIWFCASLSGIKLTPRLAGQAKLQGMNKGAPDLSFIWPDGSTTYIELKSKTGHLTDEQKTLAKTLGASMAVCRSWMQVRLAITAWMVPHDISWLTDNQAYRRQSARRAAA